MSQGCWAILALAIGMASFPIPQIGWTASHLPGDLVDGRFNLVILEHGYHYLLGATPGGFWDVPFFHPTPDVKAFSDAHLGTLPIYALARACGLSVESAGQVWYLVPFVLNFAVAWSVARRWGLSGFAAASAAYLFAFGLPLSTIVGLHAQLNPRWFVPLAYLAVRRRRWTAAMLAIVAQCYLSLYIGYWLTLTLAVWVGIDRGWQYHRCRKRIPPKGGPSRPWQRFRRFVVRSGVRLLPVVGLIPLAIPYLRALPLRPGDSPEFVKMFFPEPGAWLTVAHLGWYRPTWEAFGLSLNGGKVDAFSEKQLFLGFGPLVAIVWGLFATRGSLQRWAWGTVAMALLVTRWQGVALYDPLLMLPGVPGFRAAGRVVLVLLFPIGLMLGTFLSRCTIPRFSLLLFGLLLLDQGLTPQHGTRRGEWQSLRISRQAIQAREQPWIRLLTTQPPGDRVCLLSDGQADGFEQLAVQLDLMRAAQATGWATVNGYSSGPPWGWAIFESVHSADAWLRDWGGVDFPSRMRTLYVGWPQELAEDLDWRYSRRFRWVGVPVSPR